MGFEPWAVIWYAQTDPLSYCCRPSSQLKLFCGSVFMQFISLHTVTFLIVYVVTHIPLNSTTQLYI